MQVCAERFARKKNRKKRKNRTPLNKENRISIEYGCPFSLFFHPVAITAFLRMARAQFFWEENRFMMNGILLSHGFPIINVPAKRQQEFNQLMLDFYTTADMAGMNKFLRSCLNEKIIDNFKLRIWSVLFTALPFSALSKNLWMSCFGFGCPGFGCFGLLPWHQALSLASMASCKACSC